MSAERRDSTSYGLVRGAEIDGAYVNPGDVVIDNDPRMVAAIAAVIVAVAFALGIEVDAAFDTVIAEF